MILKAKKSIIIFLYSIGLSLPILSLFSMYSSMLKSVLILALFAVLHFIASFNKKIRNIVLIAIPIFLILLLLFGILPRFISSTINMINALSLFIKNNNYIFLGYASTFTILVSIMSFLISLVSSDENMNIIPLIMIVVLLIYAISQIGEGNMYIYTLPAWLAILLKSVHINQLLNIKVIIVIAAIIFFSFIILPYCMHTFKPLNNLAEDIRQKIRDYLFFTEERELFSIDDFGYYPYGVNRFGGPVDIKDKPVLTLKTNKKVLLRGVTKDYYNGLCFQNTRTSSRYLYIDPRWKNLKNKSLMLNYPLELLGNNLLSNNLYELKMYANLHTTLLLPAYTKKINPSKDMIPYFNESSEVFITRNLAPSDTYSFEAPIVEAGDPRLAPLISRVSKIDDPYFDSIKKEYLQLPTHLENALFDLKDRITKNSKSDYDKALDIMNFLKSGYRYTTNVKEPPQNQDFVTHFLFISKEGYCTYFASSMVVLARVAGLPARYVEGFIAIPDSDNLARVTGKNAHAWAEIYFNGFGWVPFDPTAAQWDNPNPPPNNENENSNEDNQDEDENPPEQEEPSPTPVPTPSPTPDYSPNNNNDNTEKSNILNFLNMLLYIIALLLVIICIMLYLYFSQPEQITEREKAQRKRLIIYIKAILTIFDNSKKKHEAYNTSESFIAYISKIQKHYSINLSYFANAANRAIFSNYEEYNWEEKALRDTYKVLLSQQSKLKRIYIRLIYAITAFNSYKFKNKKLAK